mmetsp:Transcript_11596/g.23386  ORF Transcript_11596/g.23386 Transcript_11596/m.23386 type:complete len:371 (-) Transcript_11596:544-1656(-)
MLGLARLLITRGRVVVSKALGIRPFNHRVGNEVCNATFVDTANEAVVPFFAPRIRPRVFDDPVIEVVLLPVPDNQHGVVDGGRVTCPLPFGARAVHDAARLDVPVVGGHVALLFPHNAVNVVVHAVGVERNGQRPVLHESHFRERLVRRPHGHELKAPNRRHVRRLSLLHQDVGRAGGRGVVGAVRVLVAGVPGADALVRVGHLVHQAADLVHVLKRPKRPAPVAAVVQRVARHELLLGEGCELPRRQKVRALHVLRRGKSPARPAVLLVRHRRHRAVVPPVEVRRGVVEGVVGEGREHVAGRAVVFRDPREHGFRHGVAPHRVRRQVFEPSRFHERLSLESFRANEFGALLAHGHHLLVGVLVLEDLVA